MTSLPSSRATRAGIAAAEVVRVRTQHSERLIDEVAVEEPLEIRIHGDAWATTMRTPGSDSELVAGLLLAEGVITSTADVLGISHCGRPGEEGWGNVIDVNLAPGVRDPSEETRRALFMNSACGVCGRAGVEDLLARLAPLSNTTLFSRDWLLGLVTALADAQANFGRTGGLHAAGIASVRGGFQVVREDIGRHNAVDKAIGRLLLDGQLPAQDCALVVSGRAGFELVQKALAAGIPALVSISAPSSLAIRTAQAAGSLLIGFARNQSFNVYAGTDR
ncbi:MAG: formate dehydrogenase accessory sulfurtransferase FdhD, partial [Polyangiaceae bacterium]